MLKKEDICELDTRGLELGPVSGSCEYVNKLYVFINGGEFLN
jgi:hypothetical protein